MTNRIAYIDTASTSAPTHDAEPWRAHCIRVAIALEEDGKIVRTLLRLVTPSVGVRCDPKWTGRYGVPGFPPEDHEDAPALAVAHSISAMMRGLTTPLMVAQNWPFHREVLGGLFEDAGFLLPTIQGFCVMREAQNIVKAFTVTGKPKPPNLGESYKFFTDDTLPLIATLHWRVAALVQLNAVRTVHWGLLRQGVPTDRITASQEMEPA